MFHNYFFLKRLARDLHNLLAGHELLECFSQSKDELILGLAAESGEVYIRANLNPQICLLQISSDFKRAKKNSIDLFARLRGKKVSSVRVYPFERSFAIDFENGYYLIFKMHASRSNVLLAQNHETLKLFRNNLPGDKELIPAELKKDLTLNFERFADLDGNPKAYIPALGKEVNQFLADLGYERKDIPEKWELMTQTLNQLESNPIWIYQKNGIPVLSLLEQNLPILLETSDAIAACTRYYEEYTRSYYLQSEKHAALRPLEDTIKKTRSYLTKTREKLEAIRERRGYEEIANILMANLHQIPKGSTSVTLHDFYADTEITIKLNPEWTPQKNAENLYRKSKNQQLEINKLEENLHIRQTHLNTLEVKAAEFEEAENIKAIRSLQPTQKKKEKQEEVLPYHQYTFEGYQIMVGKHAKANDELTLKVANKDDLWLHAKDVAGSHVVIRHQAGKNIPKTVLEHAAQLAAWFSKRKTDSLCPVIYTPKKYVRKRKGTPAGAVMVEKEQIVMVEPKNF